MTSKKIANAGFRVLELLKELCDRPLTPQELLMCIEESTENSFRKELIHKYINTLRLMNFNVEKIDSKYCLQNGIEAISLDKQDISILLFLRQYINKINQKKLKEELFDTFRTVEKSVMSETKELLSLRKIPPYSLDKPLEIRDSNIKKFEKYCEDELKLNIIYKNDDGTESTFKLAPLNVIYKKGKAWLIAYDMKGCCYKEFFIENILRAKQTPQKLPQNYPSTILFKLKNRLAKSYVVKSGEIVLEYGDDFIIVSNKSEDKEFLIKRLLRYYDQCEILYPKSCRKKLIEIVTQMEHLYD